MILFQTPNKSTTRLQAFWTCTRIITQQLTITSPQTILHNNTTNSYLHNNNNMYAHQQQQQQQCQQQQQLQEQWYMIHDNFNYINNVDISFT